MTEGEQAIDDCGAVARLSRRAPLRYLSNIVRALLNGYRTDVAAKEDCQSLSIHGDSVRLYSGKAGIIIITIVRKSSC